MNHDEITTEELAAIVEEAYIFSFPMMMGYRFGFASFMVPSLSSYLGPINELHGEPVTLDYTFKDIITPNADTPYTFGALDLRAEPLVLEVPAVPDRYYVIQFVDLFGTNPHFVGSRATGSEAGTYLLVGPGYAGDIPGGFTDVLHFETDLVLVIGRSQLFGLDDVEVLRPIMAAYDLQPMSARLGTDAPTASAFDWPVWNNDASRDERFIEFINPLLQLCQPPHPSEVAMLERFATAGIGAGLPFDADQLDDDLREAIRAGVEQARATIAGFIDGFSERVNGWLVADPAGNREFYAGDYLLRAALAMAGWGGNDKIEAYYPRISEDADGEPLSGDRAYQLRFDTPPPAKAFWSVTMYDTSYDGVAGYLVENPIGRYLISSTTACLAYGDDGSLTMHIQRDEPDTDEGKANWLPSPAGPLYLTMRIYWPETAALDGTWEPPPLVRI